MRARVRLAATALLAAAVLSGGKASPSWAVAAEAALLVAAEAAPPVTAEAAKPPLVVVGRIETPIHPASAGYLKTLLDDANADGAALVVLTLSTPGGLLASTREMSSAILASKTPVATYVSPAGASAASAGFFLLLSGDVAAMAPGTNTGAAHPVGGEGQDLPKKLSEKAEQDARAFVRTLARERGRNVAKAEAAVEDSLSYTETEAKESGLIEIVARDIPDLLSQIEGRTVRRVGGAETKLALAGFRLEEKADELRREDPRGRFPPQRGVRALPAGPRGALLRAVDARRDPSRRGRGNLASPRALRVLGPAGESRRASG